MPFEMLYMQAFWDLSTERNSDGQALGRIPWSKAIEYARDGLGYDARMLQPFWWIISELDNTFLNWMKSEHDRYMRMNKPAKKGNRQTSKRTYSRI